jgi:3-(methylthio)propanoyl-CoA dehydrogenase
VALENATGWLLSTYDRDPANAAAGAVPYLKLLGTVTGGWLMARAALVAAAKHATPGSDFYRAKKITARFYAEHVLPEAQAFREAIVNGAGSVLALDESLF